MNHMSSCYTLVPNVTYVSHAHLTGTRKPNSNEVCEAHTSLIAIANLMRPNRGLTTNNHSSM